MALVEDLEVGCHDSDVRMVGEELDLALELLRFPEIVVIDKSNDTALCV